MTDEQTKHELTTGEVGRLGELEAVIAKNFQGFYAVGCALAEINAKGLYLATNDTFEDYCRERFEISRSRAYRYIKTKEVIDNVAHGQQNPNNRSEFVANWRQNPNNCSENVNNCTQNDRSDGQTKLLPLNEGQARPLTKLEPDEQVQVWERVIETAPQGENGAIITAKLVDNAVSAFIGKELKKKAKKIKEKAAPVVSGEFLDALWALVEIVRVEAAKPLKAKMRENMRESIRRVENLLAD